MTDQTAQHLTTMFFGWSYNIATLIIGYLFARLGYTLFLKGVTGEFKFHMDIKGAKADLISASPGLFLILMGTIIVGIEVYKGMSIYIGGEKSPVPEQEKQLTLPERPPKPNLPRIPPPKEQTDESKANN